MTTGQNIWDRAKELADMADSAFPASTQALRHVNDALSELHYALAASGADWYYSEASQALTAGTGYYALPAAFYRMLKVYLTVNGCNYVVRRFGRNEVAGAHSSPQTTGTLTLCYIPKPTALAALTDTIDATMPVGWEEFAALVIAVKLLIKEDSDASQLRAERDRKLGMLLDQAIPRDDGEPEVVDDVGNRWNIAAQDEDAARFRYRVQGSYIYIYDLGDVST